MEKNWCLTCFQYPFIAVMSAFTLTTFFMITNIEPKDIGGVSVLLSLAIPMVAFYFIGNKIYYSFIGPRIRKRGWNENSFLRGLQVELIVFLFIYALPIFAIILISMGYKTLTQ